MTDLPKLTINPGPQYHPCGACGALVVTCGHWEKGRQALRNRQMERAAQAIRDNELNELLRQMRGGRP